MTVDGSLRGITKYKMYTVLYATYFLRLPVACRYGKQLDFWCVVPMFVESCFNHDDYTDSWLTCIVLLHLLPGSKMFFSA